jgi:hypothetical protein
MEQDCTVTLHCTMVHKSGGVNALVAEPIQMVQPPPKIYL